MYSGGILHFCPFKYSWVTVFNDLICNCIPLQKTVNDVIKPSYLTYDDNNHPDLDPDPDPCPHPHQSSSLSLSLSQSWSSFWPWSQTWNNRQNLHNSKLWALFVHLKCVIFLRSRDINKTKKLLSQKVYKQGNIFINTPL